MKILIATMGTRGDVQPYVALAVGLKALGHVYVLESAPHEWLFSQVAAVVHHGGAGTTAAGLRAGCPTIICPFGLDQPFWGKLIAQLGAGPSPISQKKLTSRLLADAIKSVTTDKSFRASAESIADSIQSEDGIANAIKIIQQVHAPSFKGLTSWKKFNKASYI